MMENRSILLCTLYLFYDVILHPRKVFEKIKKNELQREALIVFGLGALIPLFKSFKLQKQQQITFFADERVNQVISALSIPQLSWFILYIVYFCFFFVVFGICRLFNRDADIKSLMLAVMSISGIGIVGQIFFYFLQFMFPKNLFFWGSYLVYMWSIVLSLQAIKVTQGLPLLIASASFFIPGMLVIAFMGFTAIAPYLAWLTT